MDLKELPSRAFARHPWEIVRADFFLRILRDHLRDGPLRALDMGAGDGYFAERLLAGLPIADHVTCFDLGYDADFLAARARPRDGIAFTAAPPSDNYGLVLLLDVLEHADDDRALLAEAVARAVKPGGWLLASVPAHPALFSHHDVRLGHRRRYAPAELCALASGSGLDLVAHGQLFSALLLPRALTKLTEAARGMKRDAASVPGHIETALGTWHHGVMVSKAVVAALNLDAAGSRLAARWRLPLPGLSTWVLARRP